MQTYRTVMAIVILLSVLGMGAEGSAQQGSEDVVSADADMADAGDTAEQSGPLALIQSVKNDHLGRLSLPGFWDVTEVPDGVRAVESRSERPAAIEVAVMPMPTHVPAAEISSALVAEMEQRNGEVSVLAKEALTGDEEGLDQYYVELRIKESDTRMRYGYILVSGDSKTIVASIGAPDERFDSFEARDLLQRILASINGE